MIQRKQTIYLFIVGVLGILSFLSPIFSLNINSTNIEVTALDFSYIEQINYCAHPLGIFAGLSVILSLVTIFLYKKMKLQIKLSFINIVLNILLAAYLAYSYTSLSSAYSLDLDISMYTPLISIFFLLLAIKMIKKDINLLNSLNRLR